MERESPRGTCCLAACRRRSIWNVRRESRSQSGYSFGGTNESLTEQSVAVSLETTNNLACPVSGRLAWAGLAKQVDTEYANTLPAQGFFFSLCREISCPLPGTHWKRGEASHLICSISIMLNPGNIVRFKMCTGGNGKKQGSPPCTCGVGRLLIANLKIPCFGGPFPRPVE